MNRHLIYTNGRSGSNALVSLLNQHPNIVNYGELLGSWTLPGRYILPLFRGANGPARYLDWAYEAKLPFVGAQALSFLSRTRQGRNTHFRLRRNIVSLGVKDFAVNFRRLGMENYTLERADIRLVVLLRENTIARYLSSELLRDTKIVARTATSASATVYTPRLSLPTDNLLAELDNIERENDLLRTAAASHGGPVLMIRYEEYFSEGSGDRRAWTERLQSFLGVEPLPLPVEHEKLRRGSLGDSIVNFEEVSKVLAGSRHAQWLNQP